MTDTSLTADDLFLTELSAALTGRGWNTDPVVTRELLGPAPENRPSPRLAKYSHPEDDLRVAIRAWPGPVIADLCGPGWRADLTAAGSIAAALAAIDAAHVFSQHPEAGEQNRPVQQLLHEAGWATSLDARTAYGDELTWYSPDGTRRLRSGLEHPPARGWILALAPDFAEKSAWTGTDSTPAAVIAALALT